jgi:SAM-dependent methyltransferase
MLSKISEYNLDKDKNVLGKKWSSTYGGWFSDEENIQLFIDAIKPFLPDKELSILYVASASGHLGEKLLTALGRGKLTIVDISQEHLDENKNPETMKIKGDLLEINLKKSFDLILMRSSLDYFPSKLMQIKVLKVIKNHLNPDGLFINQPAYIPDIKERDIISKSYNITGKMGKRLFQSEDLTSMYLEAELEIPKKIGEGKIMKISEQDHIQRYGINRNEIQLIQKLLKDAPDNAEVTKNGYYMKFEFSIFISRTTKI